VLRPGHGPRAVQHSVNYAVCPRCAAVMVLQDCLPSLAPGAVHGWACQACRVLTSAYVGKARAEDAAADRARIEENRILVVKVYCDTLDHLCKAKGTESE
jgi:hypothetical protein